LKLAAIGHYIPQRVVGLEETLDLFRHYSAPFHGPSALESLIGAIRDYLATTGFRQVTVRAPDENGLMRFLEMTRELIDASGTRLDEIDMVVYVGVARGYHEPATAHILASYLGIKGAECFDILDACTSWSRAAHILAPHLANKQCRNALVLGLELNRSAVLGHWPAMEGGQNFFEIRSREELGWGVWGCTVGEAGTATLLSADDDAPPWSFEFFQDSDFHKYCGWTLPNHRDYDLEPNLLEREIGGTSRFYAFAKEIGRSINTYFSEALARPETRPLLEEAKVVIPHSVSIPPYQRLFRKFGVDDKVRYSFSEHGNTVSCGVPLALSKCIASGEVQRGDRVLLTPSGSGASYGLVSFRY
jgi:3-oxoacyl-[acyl-carrier-protein] synthase III